MMTLTFNDEELKILADVPAGKIPELLDFARFLRESHDRSTQNKRTKPRLVGALEGKVWMSDDFNDPMDFVSDEEMRVLEAMRSRKKIDSDSELREEAV
ncbi:MAG: DUF2281 domain-containing protein [Synergistaceae bacterium]|nr:DUF2281 domain-containing protein [Synergistaceae bacterium]